MLADLLARLMPHLDERQRRLVGGAVARLIGHGGIREVARATGLAESTVARGARELEAGLVADGRVRAAGGGRKRLRDTDPGLVQALLALVEPVRREDPGSALRWTTKSTRRLAAELTGQGHRVGADTVAALLKAEGFSLRAASRTAEGAGHSDREAQFRHINTYVSRYLDAGDPVISVEAGKREVSGDRFAEPVPAARGCPGRQQWDEGRPHPGLPPGAAGGSRPAAASGGPHGIGADPRRVAVACDPDTAAFAVSALHRWWAVEGRPHYPDARRLLIATDAGGSSNPWAAPWKEGLAEFSRSSGLEVTVCQLPPGTFKWDSIDHRFRSRTDVTWRGHPPACHEVVIGRVGVTGTADADPAPPSAATASGHLAAGPPSAPPDWHGVWNYTLTPEHPGP
ncbi:ISAzo13 family transposase [Streptomyces sp. NBC_00433]